MIIFYKETYRLYLKYSHTEITYPKISVHPSDYVALCLKCDDKQYRPRSEAILFTQAFLSD